MTSLPKTLMILGSGELGKELTIAAKRLGCKVIACEKYIYAPAMQVADIAEVIEMKNASILKKTIRKYKPDAVIPEIEALAIEALEAMEAEGINVIPTARATDITMNRNKIRDLASEELGIKTAKYAYAFNTEELNKATKEIGFPLLIKPVMSSSGKGQSLIKNAKEIQAAWDSAIKESRGDSKQVIVEEFIDFDLEITLLTIRQKDGSTLFCPPIGHEQKEGDYQTSWQPQQLTDLQLIEIQSISRKITENLDGVGIFGVEFFISKNEIFFSELSPRPHDTGLVTLISQNISQFDLHLRAILGIPINEITCHSPSATRVILSEKTFSKVAYKGINKALEVENTELLIFGKPTAREGRRMGVILANGENIEKARRSADKSASFIEVIQSQKDPA